MMSAINLKLPTSDNLLESSEMTSNETLHSSGGTEKKTNNICTHRITADCSTPTSRLSTSQRKRLQRKPKRPADDNLHINDTSKESTALLPLENNQTPVHSKSIMNKSSSFQSPSNSSPACDRLGFGTSTPHVFQSPSAGEDTPQFGGTTIFTVSTPSNLEVPLKSSRSKIDAIAEKKRLEGMKGLLQRLLKTVQTVTLEWQINKLETSKILKSYVAHKLEAQGQVNNKHINYEAVALMKDFESGITTMVIYVAQLKACCMKVCTYDLDRDTRDVYKPFHMLTVTDIFLLMSELYRSYSSELANKKDSYQYVLSVSCHGDSQDSAAAALNNIVTIFRADVHIKKKDTILNALMKEVAASQ